MTEDSTNNNAFAQGVACADQEIGETMTEIVNPSTTVQSDHNQALPGETNINISLSRHMDPIAVDNDWFALPVWHGWRTLNGEKGVTVHEGQIHCWKDIPIGYLAGMNHANEAPTEAQLTQPPTAAKNAIRYCDTTIDYYAWNKLNNASLELKNFLVTIERDTSGGVQVKDNLVFEVMFLPTLPTDQSMQVDQTKLKPIFFESGNVTQTDLKNGITVPMNIHSDWGIAADFYYASNAVNGQKWVHRALWEWCFRSYGTPVDPILKVLDTSADFNKRIAFVPRTATCSLYSLIFMRCINLPTMTNVKVNLTYQAELKANWTAMYKNPRHYQYTIQVDGLDIKSSEEHQAKKRKYLE